MHDFKIIDYHIYLDHQDLVDLVQEQYPNIDIQTALPRVVGSRAKNIKVWNNEDLIKAYTFNKLVKNIEIMTDGFVYLGHNDYKGMNNPIVYLLEPGMIIPIDKFYDFKNNVFLAYYADEDYEYNDNLIWTHGNVSDKYTCLGTFQRTIGSDSNTKTFNCAIRDNCKRYVSSPTNKTKVSYYTCKQWAIYTQFVNKYYPLKTADYFRFNSVDKILMNSPRDNVYVFSDYNYPIYDHISGTPVILGLPTSYPELIHRPPRENSTVVIIDNIPVLNPDGSWRGVGIELEKVFS